MTFVVFELTFVLTRAIGPLKMTFAFFLVVVPLTLVRDSRWPFVDSDSVQLIVFKLTLVYTTIREYQFTITALLAQYEIASVTRRVLKNFLPFAVWLILDPIPFIDCAVLLFHHAFTLHLVVDPVSLVDGASYFTICALAILYPIFPISVIIRQIILLAEAQALRTQT